MCIVRIADYLHITDDRINKYRLNLQNFNSQISRKDVGYILEREGKHPNLFR